jgi:uncharacterized protein YbjQ (UPF0145 family)
MLKEKNILVSTTSTLDGIDIKHYLKPVSAHIVAGVDYFSDLGASFTDIFGGRSKTYQDQLSTIYNEAIEQLKDSTIKIGGNGIIGLKVDLDEISGKGKAMFMVTAIGTAVIIDHKKDDQGLLSAIDKKIDLETIENLERKKEIIEDAVSNNLSMDNETWDFIKANRISEVADYLFNYHKKAFEKDELSETTDQLFKLIQTYIEAFRDDMKSEILYERILKESNASIQRKLCKLINDHNLLDFSYANRMLDDDNPGTKKLSTTVLVSDKLLYEKADILAIEELVKRIKKMFPETGSYGTKKGFLSSKEKEVWTCSCGKANNEIGATCGSCFKDIYGFLQHETSPPDTIEVLEDRKSLLMELFK